MNELTAPYIKGRMRAILVKNGLPLRMALVPAVLIWVQILILIVPDLGLIVPNEHVKNII
jgi:hypothetical protein